MTSNQELADLLGISTEWRTAMLAIPREMFVPATGLACPEGGPSYPIDRQARPDEWLHAVYSDASIITQRDDGKGDPAVISTGLSSSSLSAPGIAFSFLDLLAPRDHDRVLEIGTGTGYTAAVLAERLGDGNVTSIEVDPEVAKQAAANLEAAGYAPHLIVGEGAAGHPDGGPYDRVHATCAVAEIPYSWIEQTRPGGLIVTPWQPGIHHGWKTRLTVEGPSAYGRFHGPCGYMILRNQRAELRWKPHHTDTVDLTTTRLDPRTIHQAGPGFSLVAVARVPRLGMFRQRENNGSFSLLLFEIGNPDGSWAACDYEPGKDEFEVTQYGVRQLWDELEDAFDWWISQGSPNEDRFGLIVSPQDQHLWLDEPSRLV